MTGHIPIQNTGREQINRVYWINGAFPVKTTIDDVEPLGNRVSERNVNPKG
jgi:hypothetical protein